MTRCRDRSGGSNGHAAQAPVAKRPASDSSAEADIVVTGSLIRGLPKEYVASPVFSHGRKDLVRSGAGSVSEYMLTIPQNFAGDLSELATTGAGIGISSGECDALQSVRRVCGICAAGAGFGRDPDPAQRPADALSVGRAETPTVSVIPSMLIQRIDIIPDGAPATCNNPPTPRTVSLVLTKRFG